jgi:hypothetical protein
MEISPEIYTWDELRDRIRAVMAKCPRPEAILHNQGNAREVLRVRDIADYCRFQRKRIYHIGDGSREYNYDDTQAKVSKFFYLWEHGLLRKVEGADGKWRVVYQEPKAPSDETPSRETSEARTYGISVGPNGPRLSFK